MEYTRWYAAKAKMHRANNMFMRGADSNGVHLSFQKEGMKRHALCTVQHAWCCQGDRLSTYGRVCATLNKGEFYVIQNDICGMCEA